MQYWKAHYRDETHDVDFEILNTEEDYKTDPLSFMLDGVMFRGTSLGDFRLADDAQYDSAKEKFFILKWGGHDSKLNYASPYGYDLQRYALDVKIPIKAVQKWNNCEISGILHIAFNYVEHNMEKSQSIRLCDGVRVYLDDEVVSDFSLYIDGIRYISTKKTLCFEDALSDICTQMGQKYYIKCCFTCQYSEYSPYGNDDYGTMLCYCRHKEDCLKVNNKDDFFQYLLTKDCDLRQETYLCKEYDVRNRSCGYRGFVDGIL